MKGANMTPADRRKWERLLAGMLPRSRAFAAEVGPAVFGALRKAILDLSWRHTNPETAGLSDDEMVELIFEYRDRGLVAIPMSRDGDMVSGTIEVLDTATEPVRILEAAFRRQPIDPRRHDSTRRAAVHRCRRDGRRVRFPARRPRRYLDAAQLRSQRRARPITESKVAQRHCSPCQRGAACTGAA